MLSSGSKSVRKRSSRSIRASLAHASARWHFGGLVLESKHRDFGGLSALHMMADGEHFLALSDKGHWLRGRVVYRGGRPTAIADAEMAPVLGDDGRPLARRGWYDTEALAEIDGMVFVGIERVNQIVRFDYRRNGLRARPRSPCHPASRHCRITRVLSASPRFPNRRPRPAFAGTLIAISEQALDASNILGPRPADQRHVRAQAQRRLRRQRLCDCPARRAAGA
jgi:hypothetical protein